ncbi:MAG: hypothetical protein K8R68_04200, partial [Bacteroidales bacterium]|nr:hypothetical protein [Bacteroidales bacterium]
MAGELTKVMKIIQILCHKNNLIFTTWTNYDTRGIVDWNRCGQYIDIAYCGYGLPIETSRKVKTALQGNLLNGGILGVGLYPLSISLTNIIHIAVESGGGVHLWLENEFDASNLHTIAKASSFLAKFEDAIIDGKRNEISIEGLCGIEMDNVVTIKHKEDILIFVFNESAPPKKISFNVNLPKPLKEYHSNHIFSSGKISLTIAKDSFILLQSF